MKRRACLAWPGPLVLCVALCACTSAPSALDAVDLAEPDLAQGPRDLLPRYDLSADLLCPPTVALDPMADSDGDQVRDGVDNCPLVVNPDQVDRDGDGFGDVCDRAPNQAAACNVVDVRTDGAITVNLAPGTDSVLFTAMRSLVTVPATAYLGVATLTLVAEQAGRGNLVLEGAPLAGVPYATLAVYDLQLGPTHPAPLLTGQFATVELSLEPSSELLKVMRARSYRLRVREADGSWTVLPCCERDKAADGRCVTLFINPDQEPSSVRVDFKLKSL